MTTHCDCDECRRDRELLASLRELLPLLMAIARAQAMAAQTVANKWREGEGETAFRKMNEKARSDIIAERIPNGLEGLRRENQFR